MLKKLNKKGLKWMISKEKKIGYEGKILIKLFKKCSRKMFRRMPMAK